MSRFLVIQLARFGDLLQSGRLIRTLLERGETHLCVDNSLVDLAALVYPRAVVHSVPAHAAGADTGVSLLSEVWRSLCSLQGLSFDQVYNLNYSGLNRALAAMFAPETMRGYGVFHGQPLRSHWLDMAFRWTGHRRSAPLNLVDVWAGLVERPIPPEQVNPIARPGGKGLGVVLAGRQARRSLPPDVLAACIHALFEALDGPDIWLFGTETERPAARALKRELSAKTLNTLHDLTGKTTMVALHDALQGLDAVLSPDTGAMHLAAVVGAPVHGMFLSSAWAWETGPYGIGHTVWQAAEACAPCLEASPCCNDRLCLDPFRNPALLNALSGRKPLSESSGLWKLESAADLIGMSWIVREGTKDEQYERRMAQRRLLIECKGLTRTLDAVPSAIVEHFYQEADWMLPDPLP